MQKAHFDHLLNTILDSHEGTADLFFVVGRPFQVEAYGKLKPVEVDPPIRNLTGFQVERIVNRLIGHDSRLVRDLIETGSCDTSYAIAGRCRLRVNIFRQRGNYGIVMRILATKIPTVGALNLPPIFEKMTAEKTGLILVTGATGSGKTTTLAALLNEFNEKLPGHIVTLEDPIEFVHPHKVSTFCQRELGNDFNTFATGLRAALREAPKVIFVGELRDRETTEIAVTAAETGHLVVSTLHTINAGQSVNRILGMFEQAEQTQMRQRLAETLRYIVAQRLAPKTGGGRQLVMEIMGSNLRTREAVLLGEDEQRSFYDITAASQTYGWQTFDQSILTSFKAGLIDEETALAYASRKPVVMRGVDAYKHAQGEGKDENSGMKMAKLNNDSSVPPPPVPKAPVSAPTLANLQMAK